jgi:hypothetical protein
MNEQRLKMISRLMNVAIAIWIVGCVAAVTILTYLHFHGGAVVLRDVLAITALLAAFSIWIGFKYWAIRKRLRRMQSLE